VIDAAHERTQSPTGPAFADAVTFAFGDPDAQLYGLARLGLTPGVDGGPGSGSALAVLFAGREPVAALARGGLEVAPDAGWQALTVAGLSATVEEPLRRWTVALQAEGQGFELAFTALGPPAEMEAGEAVAVAGGMAGYEQVCVVSGTVRTSGRVHEVRCLGQRGHSWGEPDWSRLDSARTVAAWPGGGRALALTSVRPEGAAGHADEIAWAALIGADGAERIAEPRLSTTYDADGRQRRASLELWMHDDDGHPRRGSGEVLCGSTLELGQLELDCAFFRWRIDGREGVGRYDVLRRAPASGQPAA
jgi:hypothetical protein